MAPSCLGRELTRNKEMHQIIAIKGLFTSLATGFPMQLATLPLRPLHCGYSLLHRGWICKGGGQCELTDGMEGLGMHCWPVGVQFESHHRCMTPTTSKKG